MKSNLFKIVSLILLAGAIALSPSFVVGHLPNGKGIEIRAEDILVLVLVLFFIAGFLASGRKKIEKPPLFLPILLLLSAGFVSVLVNWIVGTLGIERGFFYFLKEIEFFVIYFFVFYSLKNIDFAKLIVKIWFALTALNVGYVIYQMISGFQYGEYGTAAICEWGVFPTGSFFLLLFIFLFNIFLYYFFNLDISNFKKYSLGALSISPILGVFGSASKTVFLAFILAFSLTIFFWFLKEKIKKNNIFLAFLILLFVIFSFFIVLKKVTVSKRLISDISSSTKFQKNLQRERISVIDNNLEKIEKKLRIDYYIYLTGQGVGSVSEVHNQYLRNFIEIGIAGSIIFLFLIFDIIKKSWYGFTKGRDNFSVGLSIGLFVATIAMLFCSLATEPFIVVKPSEVYWFFAAITMAVLAINRKEKLKDTQKI